MEAIENEDIERVKSIIKNSVGNKNILELNEKNKYGDYPLLWAIDNNNIEIVQLLIDYALQHQIILEYYKKKIEDKPKIKNLLQNYEKEMENRKKVIK